MMVSVLRNLYMRITIFYQKFYFLLFTIFLMGTIDLVVSTDFFLAMFAIPEAGPTILVLIFCVGLYMYLRHIVFKKKKKAKENLVLAEPSSVQAEGQENAQQPQLP